MANERMMWFGTRDYMTWIPCPAIGVGASKVGWQTQTGFLNGGAAIRRSITSHKEFGLSWNLTSRERIRKVSDFADGIYGTGAIYWADPFTMDTNVLPSYWATPALGLEDGPNIVGSTVKPVEVATAANNFGYPTKSARYTITADTRPYVWVPIPPGYVAWVGVTGVAGTGATIVAAGTTDATNPTFGTSLPFLPASSATRVSNSFSSVSGFTGLHVRLGGTIGTNLVLTALIVQILPVGAVPASGGFISGQGHSGCTFAQQPSLTQQSAALDLVGLSAELVETQAWL